LMMVVEDNTLSLADLTPKLSSYLTDKQNLKTKVILCLKLENIVMLMEGFKHKHAENSQMKVGKKTMVATVTLRNTAMSVAMRD